MNNGDSDEESGADDPIRHADQVHTSRTFARLAAMHKWATSNAVQVRGEQHVPFIELAIECGEPSVERTWRTYMACDLLQFTRQMVPEQQQRQAALLYHEIIIEDAACKPYMDVEFTMTAAKLAEHGFANTRDAVAALERLLPLLADVFVSLLAAKSGRTRLNVPDDLMILTAHKQSKWSCHLILSPHDGPSVLFANNYACGRFVDNELLADARLLDSEKLLRYIIDAGVYGASRPMRMAYSSKYGETHRMLLPLGSQPVWRTPTTPRPHYDASVLERSSITCLAVDARVLDDLGDELSSHFSAPLGGATAVAAAAESDSEEDDPTAIGWQPKEPVAPPPAPRCVLVTSSYVLARGLMPHLTLLDVKDGDYERASMRMLLPRVPARVARGSSLVRSICGHDGLQRFDPIMPFKVARANCFYLSCATDACAYNGGTPHVNCTQPVYLALDPLDGSWSERCFATKCKDVAAALTGRRGMKWRTHVMPPDLVQLCLEYLRTEYAPCRVLGEDLRTSLLGATAATDDDDDNANGDDDNDDKEVQYEFMSQ